ncbi:hypothetical protein LTS15_010950 [Exophiala xenobiotica]|nr:hypothetical protein LTS15_010950 [Exophiala xenobiotica]
MAFYNCVCYVGSLLAAWATFVTRNYDDSWAWRIPSLFQVCISIATLVGYLPCPESPRWLASVGKEDEAKAFLVKYHAEGVEASPLAAFEFGELKKTLVLERESWGTTSWLDLVRTKSNRHRTFISVTLGVFAQWNGVGIASYHLAPVLKTVGVTSVTDQTMISGFLHVWNLILAVLAAVSVDLVGRRKLFLASCLGMLGSYILITGL